MTKKNYFTLYYSASIILAAYQLHQGPNLQVSLER